MIRKMEADATAKATLSTNKPSVKKAMANAKSTAKTNGVITSQP